MEDIKSGDAAHIVARKAKNTVEDVKHFAGDVGEKLKPAADKVGDVAKQVRLHFFFYSPISVREEEGFCDPASFSSFVTLPYLVATRIVYLPYLSPSQMSLPIPIFHRRPWSPSSPALRRPALPSAGRLTT